MKCGCGKTINEICSYEEGIRPEGKGKRGSREKC